MTAPVRSSYWGFMSVDQQADLEAVSSFISSANYPNPKLYGVIKSSLMDSEARQGDEAQALIAA
jgi:hypothetical protein